ncbi:MAG: dTDP-4-dehydrorhamnose reductase [Flavobacteriaceae bacterium]
MVTVLVTGSGGQLGQCFRVLSKNCTELNFVFKTSKELDITLKREIEKVFEAPPNINYVINCAAYTDVDKAESDFTSANKINAIGVKNLAEVCVENKTTLIHFSTDFVFDGTKQQPYTETDSTNPINVYGTSKLKGESFIQDLMTNYFIIRTSWLYSNFGNNFVKTMLKLGKVKDEISVVDDQIGSPTNAMGLASLILIIIKSKDINYGLYHFSNKGSCSWYEFADEIFQQKKIEIHLKPILSSAYKTLTKRPKYSVLNSSKVEKTFNTEVCEWKEQLKQFFNKNYS